jgi:hypothetical protein
VAEGELGRRIGIEEFANYWGGGVRRTAYNRLTEFRRLFPEHGPSGTPSDEIHHKIGNP